MSDLKQFARLIKQLNTTMDKIACRTGRPALIGHTGEYLAKEIFSVELHESGNKEGFDGWFPRHRGFQPASLRGKTVNIKWYTKREGILDIKLPNGPDYYLVFAGPKTPPRSSRKTTRPWVINSVHLFEGESLIKKLRGRPRLKKIGIATSVAEEYWKESEIYPNQANPALIPTLSQQQQLVLFL